MLERKLKVEELFGQVWKEGRRNLEEQRQRCYTRLERKVIVFVVRIPCNSSLKYQASYSNNSESFMLIWVLL